MRYPRRAKALLAAAGIAALALPALAQESILPPGFGNDLAPLPPPEPTTNPATPRDPLAPATPPGPARPRPDASAEEAVQTLSEAETEAALAEIEPPPPPVEIPDESRRDPRMVGAIDPVQWGYGSAPWGSADGRFLSRLMRQQRTPLPSSWLHIALRNALLSRAPAPGLVSPVDWAAERAWLLLRMGEADAARMIVSGVDVDNFTPKMTQIAVQSALANADPAGLCPLREPMRQVEPRIFPLTDAICAGLEGEAASAASQLALLRVWLGGEAPCTQTVLAQRLAERR